MPIWEYECTLCGEKFQDFRSSTDPDPLCPKCNGKTKKLISVGGRPIIK